MTYGSTYQNWFVSVCTKGGRRGIPHLIDEHDGENGLVDVLGFAAGAEREREREGRFRKDIWLNMWPKWGQNVATVNSKVGQSSTKFNLREAWNSLQDDIELGSLAGTNGNSCGLKRETKTSVSDKVERFRSISYSSSLLLFLYFSH